MKLLKRTVKHLIQQGVRGFDDSVTWGLDEEIARFIVPRLEVFKSLTNGIPTEEFKSIEDWYKVLDKMIFSFKAIRDDYFHNKIDFPESLMFDWNNYTVDENGNRVYHSGKMTKEQKKDFKEYKRQTKELHKQIKEGLDLFSKYFMGLWW